MTELAHREVIMRKPEVFKMACLRDIAHLFRNRNPFYAGFGNRITDALSYRSVDVPSSRIFTIDSYGEVKLELLELAGYKSSCVLASCRVSCGAKPPRAQVHRHQRPRRPDVSAHQPQDGARLYRLQLLAGADAQDRSAGLFAAIADAIRPVGQLDKPAPAVQRLWHFAFEEAVGRQPARGAGVVCVPPARSCRQPSSDEPADATGDGDRGERRRR
jgi:hypothetical protein